MPIIHNLKITLDKKTVIQRQGLAKRTKIQPQINNLINELIELAQESLLLEPALTYQLFPVTGIKQDHIILASKKFLISDFISTTLPTVNELAILICTIGPKLEQMVAHLFQQKQPLKGLLLDGIGNAALDSLAEEACYCIENDAAKRGLQASSPISPGMPGLAIEEQKKFFELVPAEQIGIHLTSAQVMSPRKSLSMVIGIGSKMVTWDKADVCGRCNLKKTCHYKVTAKFKK